MPYLPSCPCAQDMTEPPRLGVTAWGFGITRALRPLRRGTRLLVVATAIEDSPQVLVFHTQLGVLDSQTVLNGVTRGKFIR
jgi:hypothetical protein